MHSLRITLFGQLRLQNGNAQQLVDVEPRRAQELLCYLLLHRDRLHEREKVATLMWPDSSSKQSKRYLRQALWQLRSALSILPRKSQLIFTDHEQIGIDPVANFWLDIAAFERTCTALEKKAGCDLNPTEMQMLHRAHEYYAADLLEGWWTDWCIYERERYQHMYLIALDKLLDYSEAHHHYEAGLAYGERILQFDRARESTHRQLMRLHHMAGYRSAALHQYESCVTILADELGVAPAQSTIALYEQVRADQLPAQTEPAAEAHLPNGCLPHPATTDLRCELEQIQTALTTLQARVAQLIQQIDHTQSHEQ